jgi:transcription initiation factor IIF auxiliary subunit
MRRVGWGTFNIPIEIHFRRDTGKKDKLVLDHYLNFNDNGEHKSFYVTFDKDKIETLN